MVDKIEMSLDDIIKSNKKQKPSGIAGGRAVRRGGALSRKVSRKTTTGSPRRGVASGGGGVLKGRNRGIQKAKFSRGDVNSAWKHDMYDGPKRGSSGVLKNVALTSDTSKLLVSNLDYGVSDSDIQELFAEFGPLKKAAVHYDRSGRSLGTADVVFDRRGDALKAIKQYNGVPLDGRPMNIQLATSDVFALTRSGRLGSINSAASPLRRRKPTEPLAKRGGSSASGGQRRAVPKTDSGATAGGRRGKGPAPTAEELDAELDAYVNDMKI